MLWDDDIDMGSMNLLTLPMVMTEQAYISHCKRML